MTPGQKQMIAIRELIRAEIRAVTPTFPLGEWPDDNGAYDAFAALCEAFGHEVPEE